MKITLTHVTPHGSSLSVGLSKPIFGRGGFTPEGNRLLRVLYMHGERGGYSINGSIIDIGFGGDYRVPEAINSLDKLQTQVDKYANTPIKLKFERSEMVALGGKKPGLVTTMRQVREARKGGAQILVQMLVSGNLPLTEQDHDLLQAEGIVVYGPYTRGSKKPSRWLGKMSLGKYLTEGTEDPRVVVENIIPIARRLIV